MTDREQLKVLCDWIRGKFTYELIRWTSLGGGVRIWAGSNNYMAIQYGGMEYKWTECGIDFKTDGEDIPEDVGVFIRDVKSILNRANHKVVINPDSELPYEVCKVSGSIEMVEAFDSDTDAVAFIAGGLNDSGE